MTFTITLKRETDLVAFTATVLNCVTKRLVRSEVFSVFPARAGLLSWISTCAPVTEGLMVPYRRTIPAAELWCTLSTTIGVTACLIVPLNWGRGPVVMTRNSALVVSEGTRKLKPPLELVGHGRADGLEFPQEGVGGLLQHDARRRRCRFRSLSRSA